MHLTHTNWAPPTPPTATTAFIDKNGDKKKTKLSDGAKLVSFVVELMGDESGSTQREKLMNRDERRAEIQVGAPTP